MFLSDINHALFHSVTFFGFQVNFYLNVHCKLAVFDFMAATSHVSNVRSLYKRILVLHRFLPIDLRALGDQYVKDEFRRHKSASPDDVKGFMKEWENYKDTLQVQVLESAGKIFRSTKFGTDLSEEKLSHFQEEQIGQLYELMLESTKTNRQFDIQGDSK